MEINIQNLQLNNQTNKPNRTVSASKENSASIFSEQGSVSPTTDEVLPKTTQSSASETTSNLKNVLAKNNHSNMQNAINERYNIATQSNETLVSRETDLSDNQIRWQNYVDKYSKNQDIDSQKKAQLFASMLPDAGNGEIDKPSKQISNNCWLIGGLNSLTTTETGRKLIANNIKKDDGKHIFAIHLQEAENNHLPAPKGDGIYTFTEKDVFDAQQRGDNNGLVSGDGDTAAFALAIEAYMKETNNGNLPQDKTHFSDGAKVSRLYEILTGVERKTFNGNNDTGITFQEIASNDNNNHFELIQKTCKEQSGAITLNINGHAFCVVGSDENSILVQESNLTEVYKGKLELIPDTFPPTYKIPNEKFNSSVESYGILKWQ